MASTLGKACRISPSGPITYEIRFAVPADGVSHAPYAIPIRLSVSHSRRYGKSNFFAKAAFSCTLSKEAPRITTFLFSNSADRSRYPQPSMVQPGVSAFG